LSQTRVEVTLNLREAYRAPKWRRAKRAINIIRMKAARIAKTESVKISEELTRLIFSSSVERIPKKLSLVIEKDEEGEAWVRLRGEGTGE
jgi:ribosomal protein L31E